MYLIIAAVADAILLCLIMINTNNNKTSKSWNEELQESQIL